MQFRGDYYITGDQAKKDEDGYFWFEGRQMILLLVQVIQLDHLK